MTKKKFAEIIRLKKTKLFILFILSLLPSTQAFAAYPGVCVLVLYTKTPGLTMNYTTVASASLAADGTITYPTQTTVLWGAGVNRIDFGVYWKETTGGAWNSKGGSYHFFPNTYTPSGANWKESSTLTAAAADAAYPGCVGQCAAKTGQDSDPILVGLPYHAQYYQTVGLCSDGCVQKPDGPVILDQYASDGSGYTVGPWSYTGQDCTAGVTPPKPAQPTPEDQCEAQRNACEAQCAGRAYTHDCITGSCECFGSPGYTTDPPKDPTTPTPDPGGPNVPTPQTPATDPGVGGNQLGAQIANQGKQLSQGDAQLGQLGAINSKLGAVISNQGKQLGQGDTMIDYQRRQLGVQEEIRNDINKFFEGDTPGLPEQPTLDTGLGDSKNWTEHDDPNAVGQDRASREITRMQNVPDTPLNLSFSLAQPDPALRGTMFGRELEIRFDRPWMETGYDIMHAIFIGVGYLQVFLMINRTFTGA